jgi:uncharacterized membrane-anchored protein YjiN (DUF445 family)
MSLLFRHPIKKLTLLAAFGGGYVLGTKAGRERYQQIVDAANQVKGDPRVQQATAQATEFARDTAEKVKDDPRVKDVVDKVETVTKQASDKAQDVAEQAGDKVEEVADSAKSDDSAVNPLLADEHIVVEEEIVYTSGPDIEESIDQLSDLDSPSADGKPKHV